MFRKLIQIILILLFYSVLSIGQINYFDKTFDKQNMLERCSNVLYSETGKYLFFTSSYDFNTNSRTQINKYILDENGSILDFDSTARDSGRYEMGYFTTTFDGNLACFYSYRGQNSTFRFGLKKVTLLNESIWERNFGSDTLTNAPSNLIEINDKGLLMVGQSYGLVDGNVIIIKADSMGNEKWTKNFGGTNWDCGNSACQTPDKGFLILGWTRSYGAGQRDWYLVKTDSLGNGEWQKTYGDNLNQSGWGIISLSDGNYLMSGGGGNKKGRIIKIDPFGSVIWQMDYQYPGSETGSNYLYWTKELFNGSIVAVGLTDNPTEGNAGYLQKTDSLGNLIWQHKYNFNNETDLFYNVLPTTDGGFLLSGQCVNPATNSQDAWLLKVDSLGCPYPNCTVGIEEESKQVAFNLWPNPSTEALNIEVFSKVQSTLSIKDMLGKEVFHAIFTEPKITVDISPFSKGMYVVNVYTGKDVFMKKVSVE